jgi:hypothetical protein
MIYLIFLNVGCEHVQRAAGFGIYQSDRLGLFCRTSVVLRLGGGSPLSFVLLVIRLIHC